MAIVMIAGPTCAGKSTLERDLQDNYGFYRAISHTTRPPRIGELDGRHYHFVTEDAFQRLLDDGRLMEHTRVGSYRYGMTEAEAHTAIALRHHTAFVADPNGVEQVLDYAEQHGLPALAVFVDGDESQIASRFMLRVAEAVDRGQPDWVTSFGGRLQHILGEEQGWVLRAREQRLVQRRHSYDLYVPTYDAANRTAVQRLVQTAADYCDGRIDMHRYHRTLEQIEPLICAAI